MEPALRTLFPKDMAEQKKKLMATLDFAVGALTKPDTLLPAVRALGARHVSYGVQASHYALVGAALLATLEAGLGPAFTAQTKSAWAKTYDVVSSTMLDGAAHS